MIEFVILQNEFAKNQKPYNFLRRYFLVKNPSYQEELYKQSKAPH